MRVYAESNFVLEIVLEQEQHQACEELVSLASAGSIELVLPAFALLEPYQTIVRRKDDGKRFRDSLVDHAKQLERTAWIAADVPRLRAAAGLLLLGDANEPPSQSIFLNRNTKDFDDKEIKARLKGVECDLVWKFEDGLARVHSMLAKDPATQR